MGLFVHHSLREYVPYNVIISCVCVYFEGTLSTLIWQGKRTTVAILGSHSHTPSKNLEPEGRVLEDQAIGQRTLLGLPENMSLKLLHQIHPGRDLDPTNGGW